MIATVFWNMATLGDRLDIYKWFAKRHAMFVPYTVNLLERIGGIESHKQGSRNVKIDIFSLRVVGHKVL